MITPMALQQSMCGLAEWSDFVSFVADQGHPYGAIRGLRPTVSCQRYRPQESNGPQAPEPHVFIYSALGAPDRARRGAVEGSAPESPVLPVCVGGQGARGGAYCRITPGPHTQLFGGARHPPPPSKSPFQTPPIAPPRTPPPRGLRPTVWGGGGEGGGGGSLHPTAKIECSRLPCNRHR